MKVRIFANKTCCVYLDEVEKISFLTIIDDQMRTLVARDKYYCDELGLKDTSENRIAIQMAWSWLDKIKEMIENAYEVNKNTDNAIHYIPAAERIAEYDAD